MKSNLEDELVGSVKLNYKYYKGEDLYSEGAAEDVLLDYVSRYSENEYEHVIQNSRFWSAMYHLSHVRENIVSWLPIKKTDKVLEIGSGCGAVTGALARLANKVTCVELSRKRSLINATRHKEYDNIEIMVGNFEDVESDMEEKYDYITLIGVFEYSELYISSEDPYRDFLNRIKKHLAPSGKIIIAIENKYGLKYFAGCKEDHTGTYFEGIEGYTNSFGVKTFSKNALQGIFDSVNLKCKFYYPYPDYKLPHTIYSDDALPGKGDLNTNLRNYDNDRVVLFDERKVFDSIIEEGEFPYFANSFLIIVENNDENSGKMCNGQEWPIYAKYSNERLKNLRIATVIEKKSDAEKKVYKVALNNASNEHIKKIADNYDILSEQFKGTCLLPNKSSYEKGEEPAPLIAGALKKAIDRVYVEYLSGITLETYIDRLEIEGNYDEITKILKKYSELIIALSHTKLFRKTERFSKIFGDRELSGVYTAHDNANFDMIFSNIVIDENNVNGTWNVLDYEWVFDFPVPDKFIIFRALFYQFEQKKSKYVKYLESIGTNVYEQLSICDEERVIFSDMEHAFQSYIIGGVASLEVMHSRMPSNTIFLDTMLRESNSLKNLNSPKIYYSCGEGYSDSRQVYIIPKVDGSKVTMTIPIESNMRGLRIDPTEYKSVVSVNEVIFVNKDNSEEKIDRFLVNGYPISKDTFVFDTDDAQLIIENIPQTACALRISYDVSMFIDKVYEDVKEMARINTLKNSKKPSLADKVFFKIGLKNSPEAIAEGYTYNV